MSQQIANKVSDIVRWSKKGLRNRTWCASIDEASEIADRCRDRGVSIMRVRRGWNPEYPWFVMNYEPDS